MNDDLTLADMTEHEADLWRHMVEPPDEPFGQQQSPQSGPPSDPSEETEGSDDVGVIDAPQVPAEGEERLIEQPALPAAEPRLELPDEPLQGPPEPTLPEDHPVEPDESMLEIPGAPGEAEMGPDGTAESPPESAEPVLPVADPGGDDFLSGDRMIESPPLPDDPSLDLPEEPEGPDFDINDWSIQTTMDYSGGRRLEGRERVIDVNLSIPDGFEEDLAKHIEPQMGLLRSQVMDHTANVMEEGAILGSLAGVPI